MRWHIRDGLPAGDVTVPGDKSIAHRAVMLAALAEGESRIRNLPRGDDVRSTVRCMGALGVQMRNEPVPRVFKGDGDVDASADLRVESRGALAQASDVLNAGNSGTTMRLLTGVLAGQTFTSCLDGDASLRRRPMARVIEPLALMGASVKSQGGRAPLRIEGRPLRGIAYALPVASAQVKSAVLLAGLLADGSTRVQEPVPTRDHTERLLRALGIEVTRTGGGVMVQPGTPRTLDLTIPGDMSSAAFWLAGGALGGDVIVRGVGINPTRTGFLRIVERMGVSVEISDEGNELEEPFGDVRVSGRVDRPIDIEGREVPDVVDELPLIALLATQAPGISVVRGAGELRVKESDRIATTVAALAAMDADIQELPDGFVVRGGSRLRGATVRSGGDHRLAMMLAIAGMQAAGETVVESADAASISYPEFPDVFRELGGLLDVA